MISHREAETLISARLDQKLDPLVERELSAHLATCPQCRAFARSTNALANGLRELPYLPASPTVSRGVMARVDQGRSPWTSFGGLLANPGPAFSTLAIIAVVLLLGFFVLNRFVLDNSSSPGDNGQQLASQPTLPPQTPREFVVPGTPEPTATDVPTETVAPTATEPPAPTETQAPEPTATEPPAPTATEPPAPTATTPPEPTATTPPEPTATDEVMVVKQADASTPETVDLTGTVEDAPTPTEPSTPEPSPTTAPEPTATPEETPAPEPTATPEEKSTPDDTAQAPPIVPVDGGEVVQAPEDAQATSTAAAGAPESTADVTGEDVPIQPIEATEAGDGTGSQTIEPAGATEPNGTPESGANIEPLGSETPAPDEKQPTAPPDAGTAIDLDASSEVYGNIAGDPSGRLVLDDGRMEYQPQAHPAILTSASGLEASTTPTDGGQAIALCSGDECTDVSSESANGPATDTPLSWINGALLYERNASGAITYHALVPDESGTAAISDTVLYDGGSALEPTTPVYRAEGQVWVITQGAGWLALTDSTAHLYNGPGDAQLLRFSDAGEGGIVSYVTGGKVIVARVTDPGTPIGSAPFSGVDFDVSPGGDRIVVSSGTAIEIYGLDGSLIATYESPDTRPGTVLWLNSGIVYHDEASGVLMQLLDPRT